MVALTNSRFSRTITLLITIFSLSLPAYAKYSGGTGEPNDPYQIATAEDLMLLGETPEDYDKHFILTADIDLDPNHPGRKVFDKAVIAADQDNPFTGVFDGNSFKISHLTITGESYLGLFGQLESGADIKSLGVVDVNITGSGGGLVGSSKGNISNCYSTGNVDGGGFVGGLVGSNFGSITISYSSGSVNGNSLAGGLVGFNSGSITMSYSNSNINSIGPGVGGLVGLNVSDVTYCYSTGTISGRDLVGGLVGSNDLAGNITNCYSTSAVTGEGESVGGLVGKNNNTITTSFWDIDTSGQSRSDGGIGLSTAQMQSADTFIVWGINENEIIWTIDDGRDYPRLWWQNIPGEPIEVGTTLSDFLMGEGTENSPYLIYTSGELFTIGLFPNEWDKHFKLMTDIDMSGYLFNQAPLGYETAFTGVFDGSNHIISNLTIRWLNYLFWELGSKAKVSNLGLDTVDVNSIGVSGCGLVSLNYGSITNCYSSGNISGSGGLVKVNYGNITNCYCTGTVTGNSNVGGLVGRNEGIITMSYSTGTVSGSWSVGGLVGGNTGSVTNCYSLAIVKGESAIGGLVGINGPLSVPINRGYEPGTISNSYSAALVDGIQSAGGLVGYNEGLVTNSFWDIETSSQDTSSGGTGKTTVEMQTTSTFHEAGWDFIDEAENGTENIWWIDEGNDYPRLWWELSFSAEHPDYDQWVEVGEPVCWCYKRQCHGDTDGKPQGKQQYWVSTDDLDVLIAAWNKPFAEIDGRTVNGVPLICADFDHKAQGKEKYRVSTDDLDILIANWNLANAPAADCP